MRAFFVRFCLWMACAFSTSIVTAATVTFTNDITIGVLDNSYDGSNIIVTNCVLTIDGAHTFTGLQILNGGKLTHTFDSSGQLADSIIVNGEAIVLTGTNGQTLFYTNVDLTSIVVRDGSGQGLYTNNVDYLVTATTNGLTSIQRTETSAIPDGATVQVSYQVVNPLGPTGVNLTVLGDALVDQGGEINVDGLGYGGMAGAGHGFSTGSPASGSGGGHGGYGGLSSSNAAGGIVYDEFLQPTDKGSAGGDGYEGAGGSGGGAIKLIVGGALHLNGTVTANGANGISSRSGGGSGGSILLSAQSIDGNGAIVADGGSGEPSHGGGGGGGMIALYYETNTFSGKILSRGGKGFIAGGAGTIYSKGTNQSVGLILVDNGGRIGTNTFLSTNISTFDLTVTNGGIVSILNSFSIRDLLVASNGFISIRGLSSQPLTVTHDAVVQFGGGIVADGGGYPGGQGTGAGRFWPSSGAFMGSGGSHGGFGGGGGLNTPVGNIYGSITQPTIAGSGGGINPSFPAGGAGGGVVRVEVVGNLKLDGRISADGGMGASQGAGGGAGGSIWLTAGNLSGSGIISASGGAGNDLGGGGGGGRIAIYSQTTNSFTGTIKARGGAGGSIAGAGTIYLSLPTPRLVVDNGGQIGTNTTPITITSGVDWVVSGGAVVIPSTTQTIGSLLVRSNSWIVLTNNGFYNWTVNGAATVEEGGGIAGDGAGYPGGQGPGVGKVGYISPVSFGGGGGYGGYGASITNSSGSDVGGVPYGSLIQPIDRGSGGGSAPTSPISSGPGGGALHLIVNGLLRVDGKISANGGAAIIGAGNSGGGSGGSLWLTVGGFSGTGTISANGGAGNGLGGGGSGGRIAVYYQSNLFTGSIQARGAGSGTNYGGAGTIYIQGNSLAGAQTSQISMDNGGAPGRITSLGSGSSSDSDVIMGGGARVILNSPRSMRNLVVASNAWLMLSNGFSGSFQLNISGSATVQAGGGITADAGGYPANQGSAAGKTSTTPAYSGGGGGNGGAGAPSTSALGGGSYTPNSATQPIYSGSGGGVYPFTSGPGSAGGGAIQLNVTGMLTVDGRISADGGNAYTQGGGGGAGGSIWLTAGMLSGSGVISASGGMGNGIGGGGGGGRIAIYYQTNTFTGIVRAFGAIGGNGYGGAGTIYTKPSQSAGQLVINNGGNLGQYTAGLGNSAGPIDVMVQNGGTFFPGGSSTINNLLVGSNAWVVLTNSTLLSLNLSGNFTIETGGGIIADGRGSALNQGLGAGQISSTTISGGGGGYGGAGGPGVLAMGGSSYGVVTQPTAMGSGGGVNPNTTLSGSSGGGALHISVTGTLTVNGRISADGDNGYSQGSGGGSGGSLWISAGKLSGSGVISASGGMGNGIGGGGGGGRIALYYATNAFTGNVRALGGLGGNGYGGAGTIYTKPTQGNGQLVINNNGNSGQFTGLGSGVSSIDVTIQDGGVLYPGTSSSIHNLQVAANGRVVITNVPFILTGDLIIEPGGAVVADALGSTTGQGPGAAAKSGGYAITGGGGGHGGFGGTGFGGAAGGLTYGSVTQPQTVGSAGGPGIGNAPTNSGGAGGGYIRISTPGNLRIDGRVSAEGGAGVSEGSGGGSGGSIWLDARTISGTGIISANGGAGNGTGSGAGGGGGGGRISLYCISNNFLGTISAYGGSGALFGGAGTIYKRLSSPGAAVVVVDNGGGFGTNTPVTFSTSPSFDLTVRNGALVYPTNGYYVLSNLVVGPGGTIAGLNDQTNLEIKVLGNATIQTGGEIEVDGLGYHVAGGPGVGVSHVLGIGSGGGYGGKGGASSLTPGGQTYGSAQQPVDRGSGGGFGWQQSTNGGAGGGAIRLNVVGTLTVDGRIGADGTASQQDDGGGGSGGSVWVNARAITGAGFITAEGGDGELYEGGGGGGGRIAIYSRSNSFAGTVSTAGGDGFFPGETGSIYYASNFPALAVLSQTPSGIISNGVYTVDLFFSTPLNPSLSISNISLSTPNGVLSGDALSAYVQGISQLRVSFWQQTTVGDYTINLGTGVTDIYGQSMSQDYTGTFTIVPPVIEGTITIQGTITDANGQPVAGVLLQPDWGLASTMTDSNGNYTLSIVPGYSGKVTPVKDGIFIVPSSMTYKNLGGSISNQNFSAYNSIAPNLRAEVQGTNRYLNWYGITRVTYYVQYSSNLVDWLDYESVGTVGNTPVQLPVPIGTNGTVFFRLRATY